MREIAAGERDPLVIGLRHDVDNIIVPCRELAQWEFKLGIRATYFILHDSPYWDRPDLEETLSEIASYGHEIGLHANALAVALQTGRDPEEIIFSALDKLRGWGHKVIGVAPHGDGLCGKAHFVNDEMFEECVRPEMGHPRRKLQSTWSVDINPLPLAHYGLTYETYRLPRALYLSDSGGSWDLPVETKTSWKDINESFPSAFGQLHILMHPCWWVAAFDKVVV